MTTGQLIKAARENAGLTQAELGNKIGVTGVAIMRYEKDLRQPRLEQIQAIADVLEVDAHSLMPFNQNLEATVDRKDCDYMPMTVGGRIKKARKQRGMTQSELAEKAGTAIGTIQQYELGKRQPRLEQLQRVAAALEVNVSQLLVNFSPELAEVLDFAENRGEKLVISNKADLYQSIEESIRLTYEPSPQERINLALTQLNEEGLEVAAERVQELTEIPRYRVSDILQSTPAPQEGKDTTPPSNTPQPPPEGGETG